MSKVKAVFKANDDSEHPTAEAAEKRNELLVAKKAFEAAGDSVKRCLGASALTADGQPFEMGRSADYYRVASGHGAFFPQLVKMWIYPHNAHIDADRDSPLCVRWYEHREKGGGDYQSCPISSLYSDKTEARKAWLAACEKHVAEIAQEFEEIKSRQ